MSLKDYAGLGLDDGGPASDALMSGVEDEASRTSITLTGVDGANAQSPAYLTPTMAAWYGRHVAAARGGALGEVRGAFESELLPSGTRGFLAEAELDAVEKRKFDDLKVERQAFFQRGVLDAQRDCDRLERDYERKRAMHGRDAVETPPLFYWVGLVAIGSMEGFINWDAFLKTFEIPGWATGAALIVAVSFGASGHLIGTVLRQAGETFGGQATRKVRNEALMRLAIGVLVLAAGSALVVYGRSQLIQKALDRQVQLGLPMTASFWWGTVGFFAANVTCWLLGVAWAYVKHDPIPSFAEDRRRVRKLRDRLAKLYRKNLEGPRQQRILAARDEAAQVERREVDQRQQLTHYVNHRAKFDALKQVDVRVLSLLESYRARLIAAQRRNGLACSFAHDDPARGDVQTRVTMDQDAFENWPLRLPYL